MQEILYLEVPTTEVEAVKAWLWSQFQPNIGEKVITRSGCCLRFEPGGGGELSLFVWSVQRTTYLKVFRWSKTALAIEGRILRQLTEELRTAFPAQYPCPPVLQLENESSIFTALQAHYPLTVKYFQRMPNGAADLERVYWWEQRWREGVRYPQQPRQVIFPLEQERRSGDDRQGIYDLIYLGGALGVIHAALMARLGYRVLLIERLPFGRMNREWNISRMEFQSLIDLGLFTPAEFESVIAREYRDGFHKFFDANNPPQCRAAVLHTPTVLNIAIDSSKLLQLCGQKLQQAGGEIWEETEFIRAEIGQHQVWVQANHLPSGTERQIRGRLLVDAMGTASPIAWQLNGGRTFDSVCPTVGAALSGFPVGVWDSNYGDVLNSHGDISRGRQLIWELFPGAGDELTIYLFHYHRVHPDNPGSLLELYEDFFTILPEYRHCDPEQLTWLKPTFGYIPGHFSVGERDRRVAFDRLISIGDAASLQSPLIFTGFGSLVRNLPRLTDLLDTALKHNLLSAQDLEQIRAYQSNVAVTWLFSRGMMVPTGRILPPQRVNAMLNTFFGILGAASPQTAEAFIKDRTDWFTFNRMALIAAWKNPILLYWIWDLVGPIDMLRWLGSYFSFSWDALLHACLGSWFPKLVRQFQPWLEENNPGLWFWLLARSYALSYSVGKPRIERSLQPFSSTELDVVQSR
uniref:Lycopene cyclase n=1 Tax=Cyanothece sp. (strain PCC 7425 / ATCC 29141) TaxID=395961 RepID=B8HTB3_CYAP4